MSSGIKIPLDLRLEACTKPNKSFKLAARPTTRSVCKKKKDGDRCDVCWGDEPNKFGIVTLSLTCQVQFGKCKRGICGGGINLFRNI